MERRVIVVRMTTEEWREVKNMVNSEGVDGIGAMVRALLLRQMGRPVTSWGGRRGRPLGGGRAQELRDAVFALLGADAELVTPKTLEELQAGVEAMGLKCDREYLMRLLRRQQASGVVNCTDVDARKEWHPARPCPKDPAHGSRAMRPFKPGPRRGQLWCYACQRDRVVKQETSQAIAGFNVGTPTTTTQVAR